MKRIVLNLILWTVLVLVLLTGWLLVPATFWQYVFFLRVPIVTGLLLLGLPAIAKFFLPAMLKNLFVLRGIWQLAFTILGAIAAGIAVIFVAYTILHNAPARFDLPELSEIPESWLYVLAIALALPTWIAATDLSQEELKHQSHEKTLVVVCTSGGGIQAAGWITEVLTGLQNKELLGTFFTKAISLTRENFSHLAIANSAR